MNSSLSAALDVAERTVRFTDQFFDRLGCLLPEERSSDGIPSIADFLLLDLPNVRDELAQRFEERTFATNDPEVRVYIGTGTLVLALAVHTSLVENSVEAFWLFVDRRRRRDIPVDQPGHWAEGCPPRGRGHPSVIGTSAEARPRPATDEADANENGRATRLGMEGVARCLGSPNGIRTRAATLRG